MKTRKKAFGTRTKFSASGTNLTSIHRTNSNNFYSNSFSLILDKSLQLKETPVANPIVHSLSPVDFSYPLKIFHNNLVSIKVGNNLFADVMIDPSHKLLLSSRKPLKKPSRTSSAFGLEFATQESEFSLNLLDFTTLEEFHVRSDSNIVYSEVNAKNSVLQTRSDNINFFGETKQEKTSAFFIDSQQTFVNVPSKIIFKTSGNLKWNFNPAFDSGQTQNIIFDTSTSMEVIPNRTSVDYWFGLGSLDYTTGLLDATDTQLTLQPHIFQSFIDKKMEFDVIFNLSFPSSINTKLQTSFIDFNSPDNLFFSFNFDFSCNSSLHNNYKDSKYLNLSEGVSSPKTKVMGIRNALFI